MKNDPRSTAAYALYLMKFAEAYGGEGVRIEEVAVQNEPYILTAYPSCRWEPEPSTATFVRDHLGPTLARRKTGAKRHARDLQPARQQGPRARRPAGPCGKAFIGVLGVQWDGLPIAVAAHEEVPALPVWHTETDCGNHHWEPGFNPEKPQNDFAYALDTWLKTRRYLDGGAEAYSLWNIVLDRPAGASTPCGPGPRTPPSW